MVYDIKTCAQANLDSLDFIGIGSVSGADPTTTKFSSIQPRSESQPTHIWNRSGRDESVFFFAGVTVVRELDLICVGMVTLLDTS